jgi:hypothetical protein
MGVARSRLSVPSSRSAATLSAMDWKLVSMTPAATMPGRKNRAALTPLLPSASKLWPPKITENMDNITMGKANEKKTASFSRKYIFSSRTVRSQPIARAFTTASPSTSGWGSAGAWRLRRGAR